MSEDLAKFRLPADFILERALPTLSEVAFGFEHGWIDEATAVALAMARYQNVSIEPIAEELALLLTDQFDQVPDLLESLDSWDVGVRRLWLYLALAWIHQNRGSFDNVWLWVDMVSADFGSPPEVNGFIYYLPPPPGSPRGYEAMEERWRRYLTQEGRSYEERRNSEREEHL